MEAKAGDRVGALLDEDEKTARLLGYGVYEGDIPNPMIGGFPNPKITLDNGDVVWGCECWWGPVDEIESSIADKEVTIVDINKARNGEV